MSTLAELQAAANTFKLQYICDQLQDNRDHGQQPVQAPAVVIATDRKDGHHLPTGPLSRGGSLEAASHWQQQQPQCAEIHQQLAAAPQTAAGQLGRLQLQQDTAAAAAVAASNGSTAYRSGWWQQYKALSWRELLKVTRNPADVAGRMLTFTWIALMVGLIYYDLPTDASSIRQRLNLLFSTLCFFVLMPFVHMGL